MRIESKKIIKTVQFAKERMINSFKAEGRAERTCTKKVPIIVKDTGSIKQNPYFIGTKGKMP